MQSWRDCIWHSRRHHTVLIRFLAVFNYDEVLAGKQSISVITGQSLLAYMSTIVEMSITEHSFSLTMDTASLRLSSRFTPPVKWSLYVGVYAFLSSTVMLLLLSPIPSTLVGVLGLPTGFSAFLLAGPVMVIGAVVWWAVVERRDGYTYPHGIAFGLLTALFTVLLWVLVFTTVWGLSLVLTGWFVILFVFVISVPMALVTGLTGMYTRRRLAGQ